MITIIDIIIDIDSLGSHKYKYELVLTMISKHILLVFVLQPV